jgi:hypothetical protein
MIYDVLFKGEWFTPGREKIAKGRLTFTPVDGAKLAVIDDFGWNFRNIPLVLGNTTDGPVTLIDVHRKGGEYWNATETSAAEYNPQFIFEGHLFEREEDIAFDGVAFSLFNLLEWFDKDGMVQEGEDDHQFEYSPPDDLEFTCYEGCKVKISFYLFRDYSAGKFNTILKQSCKITLSYSERKGFRDILRDIFVFVRFLTLCTYEQSYPIWINLTNSQIKSPELPFHQMPPTPKTIRLIYQNAFYKPGHKVRLSGEHLIRYDKIASEYGFIMAQWFVKSAELDPMMRLLVNPFLDKYDFSVERFMDTMRAIETFHRRHHTNAILTKEEFEARVERACSGSLTEEEAKWVKENLNWANAPSLKQRIAEMVQLYSFPYFVSRVPDSVKFCKEVGDSRNYYTHFDPRNEKKALKGKELFDAMENIKILLFAGVFSSIGIKSDLFNETIQRLIYST